MSETMKSQKRMKTKNLKPSNLPELNKCQCRTMSVSRQCQDLVNVRVT